MKWSTAMDKATSNPNIFMSFDLELNQPSGKIISIGYVIANLKTGEILLEKDVFVKIDEPVSEFIQKLTDINDQILEEKGLSLTEAYEEVERDHAAYQCWWNPIVWGCGDSRCLKMQLGEYLKGKKYIFGDRELDAKTVVQTLALAKDLKFRGGLAKSMIKFGLKFEGTKHHSMDDAKNTFFLYKHLCDILSKV